MYSQQQPQYNKGYGGGGYEPQPFGGGDEFDNNDFSSPGYDGQQNNGDGSVSIFPQQKQRPKVITNQATKKYENFLRQSLASTFYQGNDPFNVNYETGKWKCDWISCARIFFKMLDECLSEMYNRQVQFFDLENFLKDVLQDDLNKNVTYRELENVKNSFMNSEEMLFGLIVPNLNDCTVAIMPNTEINDEQNEWGDIMLSISTIVARRFANYKSADFDSEFTKSLTHMHVNRRANPPSVSSRVATYLTLRIVMDFKFKMEKMHNDHFKTTLSFQSEFPQLMRDLKAAVDTIKKQSSNNPHIIERRGNEESIDDRLEKLTTEVQKLSENMKSLPKQITDAWKVAYMDAKKSK